MIYFTADTHFGHKRIIEYCKRPFVDVIEMREQLLRNINDTVGPSDELWHLGDFGWEVQDVKELLGRINCKNIKLIKGNHDNGQAVKMFGEHYEAHTLKWNHQRFFLCHYPLMTWNAHFQLHGHWHCKGPARPGQLDVGVDGHAFTPWSIEEVVQFVQKRDADEKAMDYSCSLEEPK